MYYHGKPQDSVKTDWIMHEFTAKDADYDSNNNHKGTTGENDMQVGTLTFCNRLVR